MIKAILIASVLGFGGLSVSKCTVNNYPTPPAQFTPLG